MSQSINKKCGVLSMLFQAETSNVYIQLLRYGIVGGISLVGDAGTLYALTEFAGVQYLVSACAGFCVGILINYFLSIAWVFTSKGAHASRGGEFLGWVIIGLIGLGLNALIMWFFTELLSVYYLGSKLISTVIVFIWNFAARRFLISKI